MALLVDIKAILVSAGMTAGSIFLGVMPPTPDKIITLVEYIGEGPVLTMGSDSIGAERLRVQVIVRGEANGYEEAMERARTAYRALRHVTASTINTVKYYHIEANQAPFPIEQDTGDRTLIVFNTYIVRESTT